MLNHRISKAEKKKAVQYLIGKLPAKTVNEVAALMNKKGRDWEDEHHHGFGMYVRNLLRKGGFGWGSLTLDRIWIELTEEAVRTSPKTKIEILPFPPEKKPKDKKGINPFLMEFPKGPCKSEESKEDIWTDNPKIRV